MHPTPDQIAQARAAVVNPASVSCHPAVMQSAWATLKQARGQSVNFRLLHPAHVIRPAAALATPPHAQNGLVAALDAARLRALPLIRARIHARADQPAPTLHPSTPPAA